ncbi:MAG TPA: lysophospholipase [Chitinophagales bacterium]|nr:lysophospholipase [Chitinophagales bacterium]
MKSNTFKWTTSDGLELFAKSWQSENQTSKAVITLVHGLGEHIERYEHVAKVLTDDGYAIVGYDHRGHGKSDGNRGHIPDYEQFMDDVTLALNKTRELFPNLPLFIYGHSMGGGLVANYLIRRQPKVKAAILTAPYFGLTNPQPAIKLALGRFTQNLVPKLSLPSGLNADHISRDPEEVRKYKNDPLVHDKISAKMGISMVDVGAYAVEHANKISVPTLVFHGKGDEITSPKASAEFARNAGNIVQIELLDKLYHEIHNEPEKEMVFKSILKFLNSLL